MIIGGLGERKKTERGKWISDVRPLKGRRLEVHWLKGSDPCYQDGGEHSYIVVVWGRRKPRESSLITFL